MKIDDNLSEIFDTPQITKVEEKLEVIDAETGEIVKPSETKVETDFDSARNNLQALLNQGKAALEHALEVAKQSEHPRAFEVVGNLIKQLADVNQQLMDLHQQKQKIEAPAKGEAKKVTNNNAIFVGSTAELNKLIKDMQKGE
jgi:ElaB/YqjD/DUF883 family membrane-anchored ribosome-binding protein